MQNIAYAIFSGYLWWFDWWNKLLEYWNHLWK